MTRKRALYSPQKRPANPAAARRYHLSNATVLPGGVVNSQLIRDELRVLRYDKTSATSPPKVPYTTPTLPPKKRPTHTAKETYSHCERDLLSLRKRPTHTAAARSMSDLCQCVGTRNHFAIKPWACCKCILREVCTATCPWFYGKMVACSHIGEHSKAWPSA